MYLIDEKEYLPYQEWNKNSPYWEVPTRSASDPAAGGPKKHEIYMAAFGGHLFYDLFVQGWGGAWPSRHPPGSATAARQALPHFLCQKTHEIKEGPWGWGARQRLFCVKPQVHMLRVNCIAGL